MTATQARIARYLVLVGLPAMAIPLALHRGTGLGPALYAGSGHAAAPLATDAPLGHPGLLVAQLLVILVLTRGCGRLVRRVGQPQVVGEMLAGILLGPSLFGAVAPAAAAALFPLSSLGALNSLSQVGMVLFMFLVGLELDTTSLRAQGHAAILTSHVSIVFPFALGTALALPLYARFAPAGVPFPVFALFLGAAMSVTAFPVLARILAERGQLRTPLGTLAMSTAAVDDVTAWMILGDLLVVVLLPLYFAFTGLRTRLDLLGGHWGWAAAILLVAVSGKLVGSALAARLSGLPGREALAVGTLMNTRGLMELVILNVGLDLGVLSPALYSMMVLMAVTTTVMTQPLLSALGVPGTPTSDRTPGPAAP